MLSHPEFGYWNLGADLPLPISSDWDNQEKPGRLKLEKGGLELDRLDGAKNAHPECPWRRSIALMRLHSKTS